MSSDYSSANDTVNVTLKNYASDQVNACLETLIEESSKGDYVYIICDTVTLRTNSILHRICSFKRLS